MTPRSHPVLEALSALRSALPKTKIGDLGLDALRDNSIEWPKLSISRRDAFRALEALRTAVHNKDILGDERQLGRVIGAGSFGVVIEIGSKSALKLVRPDVLKILRATSTADEFDKLKNLKHPHIVGCECASRLELSPTPLFAVRMARVDGEALTDKLRKPESAWALKDRLDSFRALCDAVFYLHDDAAAQLLHLDIKPDNLRYVDGGALRLLDFGIAQSKGDSDRTVPLNALLGTAGYAAPEQCPLAPEHQVRLSPRSDIFALGVVLFELTTGARFYEGKDENYASWLRDGSQSRAEAAANLIRKRFPDCGAAVAQQIGAAIAGAVRLADAQRPQTARALRSLTLDLQAKPRGESRTTTVGELTAAQRGRLELTKRETGEADTLGRALGVTGDRIQLAEIHLRLAIRDISTGDGKEATRYLSREGEGRDFIEATKSHEFLLIKGVAGSGKTTVLRYLANALARKLLSEELEGDQRTCIPSGACPEPLLIRLRDVVVPPMYIAKPEFAKDPNALNTILSTWLHSKGLTYPIDALVKDVAAGNCILLLDGLDEVRDEGERAALAKAIGAFARKVSTHASRGGSPTRARVIVSSRPAAIENIEFPAPLFQTAEVLQLKDDQVGEFARKWTRRAMGIRTEEDLVPGSAPSERCRSIAAALDPQRSPELFELAHNPMLLTLILLVHHETGSLPVQRVALYDQAVDVLLRNFRADWEVGKSNWSPRRAREVLADVAWKCFNETPAAKGSAALEQTTRWITEHIRRQYLENDPEGIFATDFLEQHNRKGFVLETPREPVEKFLHRSIREFLAGWWLANCSDSERLDLFRKGARDPSKDQHEALRMMAGVIASRGAAPAARFVLDILGRSDPQNVKFFAQRASDIAAAVRLVGDMRSFDLPPAVFQSIEQDAAALIAAIENPKAKQSDRISFAEALGVYGDPRLTDTVRWIEIGAGTFKYGMHDELVDTPIAAYALARWPVTIAEYARFVDEDGYANDAYWKAGRGGEGVEWQRPEIWQSQLRTKASNHPVVGVSWFEAKAYCAWLTASQFNRTYEFDLPTDAQWEAAARGTLTWSDASGATIENPMPDRDYPWGHARDRQGDPKFELGRANIDSSGVRNTSPVGSFPGDRGPFGHWDLAGNVREWCNESSTGKDLAAKSPYYRAELSAKGSFRVFRGGSFRYNVHLARCSGRLDDLPWRRGDFLGFRPARVSADLLQHLTSGESKKKR